MKFIDKLERKFGRFGIPNLTVYIIGCYVLGYFLAMFAPGVLNMLSLDMSMVMKGQIWRLVTWVIYPPSSVGGTGNLVMFLLAIFFFYYPQLRYVTVLPHPKGIVNRQPLYQTSRKIQKSLLPSDSSAQSSSLPPVPVSGGWLRLLSCKSLPRFPLPFSCFSFARAKFFFIINSQNSFVNSYIFFLKKLLINFT